MTWKYIGSGSGGTAGSLQTVTETYGQQQREPLMEVSYNGSGLPQYLYNADELAPGYSGSAKVTVTYESSGLSGSAASCVASVANGPISGATEQSPTATSTWTFGYNPLQPRLSPCYTADTADAHGSLAAGTPREAGGYTSITPPCQQSGSAVCSGRTGGEQIKVFYDFYGQEMERVDELGNYTQDQYSPRGSAPVDRRPGRQSDRLRLRPG